MNKKYNIQYNIGKSKYVVNFYDGIKENRDGSPAYDIMIFKNKKRMNTYLQELYKEGYREANQEIYS